MLSVSIVINKIKLLFNQHIKVQLRVINALFYREIITRYGRKNIGIAWLIVEPLIFTLGVSLLWFFLRALSSDLISPTAFAVTGYSTVLLWRQTTNRCVLAVEPNLALMYHRNVALLDVFLARIFLEICGTSISFFVLTVFFVFIGAMSLPVNLLQAFTAWILLAWFSLGLSIFIGCVTHLSSVLEKLWHPTTYLLFPLSGALFLVEWLPIEARDYALIVPMVHMVEYLREAFFGPEVINFYYDLQYFISFCIVLSFTSLVLLKFVSKRMESE